MVVVVGCLDLTSMFVPIDTFLFGRALEMKRLDKAFAVVASLALVAILTCGSRAATIDLVVNGEFEDPVNSTEFDSGGLFDVPNESIVPGWSNANPNTNIETGFFDGLVVGETLELWAEAAFSSPNTGSDGNGTGQHAEVEVLDPVVGADVTTQSFVIPAGVSPLGSA